MIVTSITDNLSQIKIQMQETLKANGRNPDSAKLIAVSKTKPAADIVTAYQTGQLDFGENYIQEWQQKATELSTLNTLRWHFIGHIQSNKLKLIAGKIFLIHTIDRLELAQTLQKLCEDRGVNQNILLQIKISEEESKSGCAPRDLPELLKRLSEMPNITVQGLMTIGTLTDDPKKTRDEYRSLKNLLDDCNANKFYRSPLFELSMGMSSDFRIALEEGSTLIRIGTQIFGSRQ